MDELKDAQEFFALQQKFKEIPYTQSNGFFNYKQQENVEIVFFVDSQIDLQIALWGISHKLPFSSKKFLRIEGECYKNNLSEKVFKTFYKKISELPYAGIEMNSNHIYNMNYEIGVRRAGFKRPLALFSCPLTIELDLQNKFSFDTNWKRNVRKAEKHKLYFKELEVIDSRNVSIIIQMFSEMAALKGLKYSLEPLSLKHLLESKDIRVFLVFDKEDQPLAARIIHVHNKYASDIYAANSISARNFGASYFMMEKIFFLLRDEEFLAFDFGRIPPSNHETDNIYLFKNASRGEKIQYNGEWVFYNNSLIEGLLYIYKRFVRKKQRY